MLSKKLWCRSPSWSALLVLVAWTGCSRVPAQMQEPQLMMPVVAGGFAPAPAAGSGGGVVASAGVQSVAVVGSGAGAGGVARANPVASGVAGRVAAPAATPAMDAGADAGLDAGGDCAASPKVVCTNGMAGPYPCQGVDMLARIPLADFGARAGNAVWGGVESKLKREIAVVGLDNATAFVDVSNPSCPKQLGRLPSTSGRSPTHDVKVLGDFAVIVAEINNHGMQVFDMRNLGTTASTEMLTPTATYRGTTNAPITNAHNVVVNPATNFVYIVGARSCMGGLHMVDFRDPAQPKFLGCGSSDHYVHDAQCVVYSGPDMQYVGRELCITFNGDNSFSVVDVQDKSAPRLISRTTYQGGVYSHNGALNDAQTHLILSDELDEQRNRNPTRTYLFNVSDLDKPTALPPYDAKTKSIDHNLFVRRDYVYQANYESGLHILDASEVAQGKLREVAFFDTFPMLDAAELKGAWTAYPHFDSGTIVMGGTEAGLFLLAAQPGVLAR